MAGDSLDDLAQDLNEAVHRLGSYAEDIVEKGALQVKNDARKRAFQAHSHTSKVAAVSFINYSMQRGGSNGAEVGYDKTGPGNFGTFNEYGSAVGNSPDNAIHSAADKELPVMAKYLVDAAAAMLMGRKPKKRGTTMGASGAGATLKGSIGGLL
jgi:hypothetical protein